MKTSRSARRIVFPQRLVMRYRLRTIADTRVRVADRHNRAVMISNKKHRHERTHRYDSSRHCWFLHFVNT